MATHDTVQPVRRLGVRVRHSLSGVRPYWARVCSEGPYRPAAEKSGIDKIIGWHTFRHSLASLLGNKKESTKTVQEIMRHASSRITLDLYMHGDEDTKQPRPHSRFRPLCHYVEGELISNRTANEKAPQHRGAFSNFEPWFPGKTRLTSYSAFSVPLFFFSITLLIP
jgi:Phage integrase family